MNQAMTSQLESILFAAGEPVALTELASVLALSKPQLRTALSGLQEQYVDRGIRLIFNQRQAQLVTAPEMAPTLAKFRQSELRGELSPGVLEALAIIAYRGPVTRPDIDAIRGVRSAGAVRTLAMRGLIDEIGRRDEPGRPILYDTTLELLKHLGISSRQALPSPPPELVAKLKHQVA